MKTVFCLDDKITYLTLLKVAVRSSSACRRRSPLVRRKLAWARSVAFLRTHLAG